MMAYCCLRVSGAKTSHCELTTVSDLCSVVCTAFFTMNKKIACLLD